MALSLTTFMWTTTNPPWHSACCGWNKWQKVQLWPTLPFSPPDLCSLAVCRNDKGRPGRSGNVCDVIQHMVDTHCQGRWHICRCPALELRCDLKSACIQKHSIMSLCPGCPSVRPGYSQNVLVHKDSLAHVPIVVWCQSQFTSKGSNFYTFTPYLIQTQH